MKTNSRIYSSGFPPNREGFNEMPDIHTLPTFTKLATMAASEFNITMSQLLIGPKNKQNTAARRMVLYVAYRHYKVSLADIANFFNRANYSNVVYAYKSAKDLASVYPAYKKQLEDFEAKVLNYNR